MNSRISPGPSASSGVFRWNIYLGSSRIRSMELSPNNTPPVEVFQQEFNSIKNCLLLACKAIPACLDYITDLQFLHGPACQHLPETAYHRDRWVHGMFYEIVSKMLFTSLLLMRLCVISIACFVLLEKRTSMGTTCNSHPHLLSSSRFWARNILVTVLSTRLQPIFSEWFSLPLTCIHSRRRCGGWGTSGA